MPPRAERHPHSDLVRPLRDSISDESVKADGGKRERQESEKGRECRNETLQIDRPVDFLTLSQVSS